MTSCIHPAFREIANFLERLKRSLEAGPLTTEEGERVRDFFESLDDRLKARKKTSLGIQVFNETNFPRATPERKGWYRSLEQPKWHW